MADLTINLGVAGAEVVTGALRRVGEVAINALGAAFKVVGDFAADSFKGALEAQQGIDTFNAALTRTGKNAPITADAAMALSQSLKNLTGGSDDTILAMEEMGLRFDKIGANVFPRFIESSADLAAQLKKGPVETAQLLGKIMQDASTDGAGAFDKLLGAGIKVTDAFKDQFLELVKGGEVEKAQILLLDEIAKTTGGKAADAANTLTGRWAIFKETIADAGEGVMMALLPGLTELSTVVLPPLVGLVTGITDGLKLFIETGNAAGAIETVFAGLTPILDALGISVQDQVAFFREFWGLFNSFPETIEPIKAGLSDLLSAFSESMPMIQAFVGDMIAFVSAQFAAFSPMIIANVGDTLNRIATFWRENGDEIMAVVNFVFRVVTVTIGGALTLITGVIDAAMQLITGDWRGAWDTVRATLETILTAALSITGTSLAQFVAIWQNVFNQVVLIVTAGLLSASQAAQATIDGFIGIGKAIVQGIADGISSGAQWITDAAMQAAQSAINAVKNFLGIHSPSSVFADIGANTMAGLAQGISAASYMPAGAAGDAARQTTQSTVNNMGGNTYNYYGVQADTNAAYTRALAGAF